jgi:hypothetical protein
MPTIKERKVENPQTLKDRHGFILHFGQKIEKNSLEKSAEILNHKIKEEGLADKDIEFYFEPKPNVYAFVYPKKCSFRSGDFIQEAVKLNMFLQMNGCRVEVDTLANFIKNHK